MHIGNIKSWSENRLSNQRFIFSVKYIISIQQQLSASAPYLSSNSYQGLIKETD